MNSKEQIKSIIEKLNNIDEKYLLRKKILNETKDFDFLKEIQKASFGKNVKYLEYDMKKAADEYYDYIIWNGLKYRNKAIEELVKKYGFNKDDFVEFLKKKKLYDMNIPYRELKENKKISNLKNKIKKIFFKKK